MSNRTKYVWPLLLLLILSPILVPAAIVAVIVVEHVAFGTRYFSDGLEAIGLTPLLEALFNYLGMNG